MILCLKLKLPKHFQYFVCFEIFVVFRLVFSWLFFPLLLTAGFVVFGNSRQIHTGATYFYIINNKGNHLAKASNFERNLHDFNCLLLNQL